MALFKFIFSSLLKMIRLSNLPELKITLHLLSNSKGQAAYLIQAA
jgi:hypothetical protein